MTEEQYNAKLAEIDKQIEQKKQAKKDLKKKLDEFKKSQEDSFKFLLGEAVLKEIKRIAPVGFSITECDREEMKLYADRLLDFLEGQDKRGNYFANALFPQPPQPDKHELSEDEQSRTDNLQQSTGYSGYRTDDNDDLPI